MRLALVALLLALPAAAEGETPKQDPFAEVLATLPAKPGAVEAIDVEIVLKDKTVGWGFLRSEPRGDAGYTLREHFVFHVPEVVSATTEADVDARFRPTRVRIEQVVRGSKGQGGSVSDLLEADETGFKLTRSEDRDVPMIRRAAFPEGPYVVGIEFLIPRLPRERIDGLVLTEFDLQVGAPVKKRARVAALPEGRTSIVLEDAEGKPVSTFCLDAQGRMESIQQGEFVFRVCPHDRWEQLRKELPDVE